MRSDPATRQVTLLHFQGCPSWETARDRLEELADELGFDLALVEVDTTEDAERLRFRGSPSILLDGVDVFAEGDEPVGLSCRVYDTPEGPAGSPTVGQLRDALAGRG
ncbi:MAG: thioredoxin family protein [Actinomycetes bacterium]